MGDAFQHPPHQQILEAPLMQRITVKKILGKRWTEFPLIARNKETEEAVEWALDREKKACCSSIVSAIESVLVKKNVID